MKDVHQKFPEVLSNSLVTIDYEEIKLSPVDLLQKLLNKSIFSRTTPDYCIVLITHQKTYGHYSKLAIVNRRPSLSTLMNFLSYHTQHSWHTRSTNINVKQPNLIFLWKQYSKLGSYCTFSYTSLSRQYKYLMFDVLEFIIDKFDSRIDLDCSCWACWLVRTSCTSFFFASLFRIDSWALLVGILRYLFLHQNIYIII